MATQLADSLCIPLVVIDENTGFGILLKMSNYSVGDFSARLYAGTVKSLDGKTVYFL